MMMDSVIEVNADEKMVLVFDMNICILLFIVGEERGVGDYGDCRGKDISLF